MTAAEKTATQELQDAIAVLGDTAIFADLRLHLSEKDVLGVMTSIDAASAAIERALNIIQHARCNALASLDRF
jgi:hypothetical protein